MVSSAALIVTVSVVVILAEVVQGEIGATLQAMVVVMEEAAAAVAVVVAAAVINAYILSGTLIPNNPIEEAITFAVISESLNLNCFFSSDSAFITECSV